MGGLSLFFSCCERQEKEKGQKKTEKQSVHTRNHTHVDVVHLCTHMIDERAENIEKSVVFDTSNVKYCPIVRERERE